MISWYIKNLSRLHLVVPLLNVASDQEWVCGIEGEGGRLSADRQDCIMPALLNSSENKMTRYARPGRLPTQIFFIVSAFCHKCLTRS